MYDHPMHLDRKLYEDVGVNFEDVAVTTEMFGFEIELEGKKIRSNARDIAAVWEQHNDNSLRVKHPGDDAVEYVLRRPLKLEDTLKAVDTLFNHLNSEDVEVFNSYRTSIHVHVNCAADKMRHVMNFITLAVIFDELFVSQNGEHRIGNNFCLRAKDAQGQIDDVVRSITHNGNIFGLNGNHRYSSVNFVSLCKYCTLEFRSLECTTDFERVKHWINTLATLKTASRQFDDPQDIIRYFSRMSEKEFLYFVLGTQASKYAKVPGFEGMLREGMRLAQDIAYAASWKTKGPKDVELEKEAKLKAKKKAMHELMLMQAHMDGGVQQVAQPVPAIFVHANPAAQFADPWAVNFGVGGQN